MKLLLDNLPVLSFFGAYLLYDLYAATIALIGASAFVVILYRWRYGQWNRLQLVVASMAATLGGLTLYLHDPAFIKLKPTAVYALFSIALLTSHVIGQRVLLARLPQSVVNLPEPVWRRVNFAWAIFFAFCAVLNLYVAYQFSEATWVKIKTFGFSALMIVFILGHAPLLSRYLEPATDRSGKGG